MNVIPPIPSGGQEPAPRPEPSRPASFSIDDMTPPMQGQGQPAPAPLNEPRLFAVAADTARNAFVREIDRIDYELNTLSKRIGEIEKILEPPAPPALSPRLEQEPQPLPADTFSPPVVKVDAQSTPVLPVGQSLETLSTAPEPTVASPLSLVNPVNQVMEPLLSAQELSPPPVSEAPEPRDPALALPRDPALALSAAPIAEAEEITTFQPTPDMLGLPNFADVVGEIENRRGGIADEGRGGDNLEQNAEVIEISGVGTPELFKGLFLRGYQNIGGWDKEGPNGEPPANPPNWVPLSLQDEIANIDELTMLRVQAEEEQHNYCLQATWDWVRAKYVPEVEESGEQV